MAKLPTAQQLVSAYKAGGPLTAAQITGAAPLPGGGSTARNPKDAPGYDPTTDPTSSAYGRTPTPAVGTTPIAPAPTAPVTPTTAPTAAQVTPPNAQMDMATAIAGKGAPLTSAEMASPQTIQSLADQYRRGVATMAGKPAPTTQWQAMAGVQGAMPQARAEQPSIIGGIIETDTNFDSILTMWDDFMSPAKQKQTLIEEYTQLSKSLGIEAMNAELIDAKRIIEGTEDDIRAEITAAGGFGTESQVLALANARNKSLIKNYNYLLDSRNNATTQLTTMMNLSIQDRQMAQAEFDRKMNFAFKVAEFQQTATNNARNFYAKYTPQELIAMAGGNAYNESLIEKTMGFGVGGLQRMAALPPEIETQVVSYGEGSALVNSQTGEIIRTYPGKAPTGAGAPEIRSIGGKDMQWDPTSKTWIPAQVSGIPSAGAEEIEPLIQKYNNLTGLLDTKGYEKVVGTFPAGRTPFLSELTGVAQNATASIKNLISAETLNTLINLKKAGGTLGALSEGEALMLREAASKIGAWEVPDPKTGLGTGRWNASEKDFRIELERLRDLTLKALNRSNPTWNLSDKDKQEIQGIYGGGGITNTNMLFNPADYY